jgi:hypothetical protein
MSDPLPLSRSLFGPDVAGSPPAFSLAIALLVWMPMSKTFPSTA